MGKKCNHSFKWTTSHRLVIPRRRMTDEKLRVVPHYSINIPGGTIANR